MNNDFADLETELRALQPLPPSEALAAGLAEALDAPPTTAHAGLPPPWWQSLGFRRPFAALAWGLVTPAAAVCAVLLLHPAGVVTPAPAQRPPATALAAPGNYEPATTSDVVYQTKDEGVVYDADQQPARQVRYRSRETLAWRNPQTGAQVEVSYPREEVVLTPIALR